MIHVLMLLKLADCVPALFSLDMQRVMLAFRVQGTAFHPETLC